MTFPTVRSIFGVIRIDGKEAKRLSMEGNLHAMVVTSPSSNLLLVVRKTSIFGVVYSRSIEQDPEIAFLTLRSIFNVIRIDGKGEEHLKMEENLHAMTVVAASPSSNQLLVAKTINLFGSLYCESKIRTLT